MSRVKKDRMSIAINPRTKAVYENLAQAGNYTLSKAVADFLETMEPYAEFLAEEYRQALLNPSLAVKNATDMMERVRWQIRVEKESSKGWKSEFEGGFVGTKAN